MRSLQSVQRRTGFETLEAKKLFAADLIGGAADPVEVSSAFIGTDGFADDNVDSDDLCRRLYGDQDAFVENLGGHEGEDFNMDLGRRNVSSTTISCNMDPDDAVLGIAAIDTNGISASRGESQVISITATSDNLMNTDFPDILSPGNVDEIYHDVRHAELDPGSLASVQINEGLTGPIGGTLERTSIWSEVDGAGKVALGGQERGTDYWNHQ